MEDLIFLYTDTKLQRIQGPLRIIKSNFAEISILLADSDLLKTFYLMDFSKQALKKLILTLIRVAIGWHFLYEGISNCLWRDGPPRDTSERHWIFIWFLPLDGR